MKTTMKTSIALLVVLLAAACAHRQSVSPAEMSGFLSDYTSLREGGPGEVWLVYRDPKADWSAYHKVLLEPVTLWRSGRKALEPVPREDLLRLVTDLQGEVRAELERGFQLVDQPGPGVMRIHLAITEARAADPVLDILRTSRGSDRPHPAGDGPLHPETRRFLQAAVIEGEIRDATTDALLAEGVDRRKEGAPAWETWADVDRAFAFWAGRMCKRLEARTEAR